MTAHRPLSVTHVTAERGFSGGESQLFLLVEGLRARGHRGVLLCPEKSRSEEEARARGIEVLSFRGRGDFSPRSFGGVARGLRAAAPDLVHLHTQRAAWIGGAVAWWRGLPAVATRRMDRPMKRGWRNRFVYGRAAAASVAISEAVAGRLADCGVPRASIAVVPSAVDGAALRPRRERDLVRRELGAGTDETCLLVTAALVRRKGIDVLLDALARLAQRDLEPPVWVAGAGPLRSALETRARELGLAKLHFLGQRRDVAELLAACDVCVLPSRREGLGVAALEAMASARPVVASRVGGLAEAVAHEGTGLLVPPEHAGALAEALERLLRDASLRRRLGQAGPGRVARRHAVQDMVDAYERLYRQLLASATDAGR